MVDQLLGGLFGGQDDDDDTRRSRARDFVSRYEQGRPEEGYDDDEVYQNYRSVSSRLSPEEYEEAAAEAFSRMDPDQRRQMKRMMRERGGLQGGQFDDDNDDPRELARMTSRYRQQDQSGSGLAGLFGFGGGGGATSGDLMSAARGGGGGGGLGDLMGNPVAKAAMAGVAAIAMKKMIGR